MPKTPTERRDNTLLNHIIEIKKDLAANTTETKNINARLDKLNGSIARHETDLQLIKETVKANTLKIDNVTKKEDGQSETWRRWSDKLIWTALVIVAMLFYYILTNNGFPHFLQK